MAKPSLATFASLETLKITSHRNKLEVSMTNITWLCSSRGNYFMDTIPKWEYLHGSE